MLDELKTLLGLPLNDESQDELLELLIKQATQEAKAMTSMSTITPALRVAIVKMAVYNFNRLGTEGLNSENYSGASYNYTEGYPAEILSLLDAAKAQGRGGIMFLW